LYGDVTSPTAAVTVNCLADEGAFAFLADYDACWQPTAMHDASKLCTNDTAQFPTAQKEKVF
jgi:hypothetical protein